MDVAAIGRHAHLESITDRLHAELHTTKKLEGVRDPDDAARGFREFRGAQTECLRLGLDGDDIDGCFRGASRALHDQFRGELRRGERVIRIDAALESIRRIGLDAEAAGGAADDGRLEPRALEQHIARRVRDLALSASDDPAESDGAAAIGNDDSLRIDGSRLAVETDHLLAAIAGANEDRCGQLVEIESMQRMTEGQHGVVGGVDHVVDRPQADRFQSPLDERRRRLHGHAADHQAGIAAAHGGGLDADRNAGILAGRPAGSRRYKRTSERRCQFPRHAEVRHGVDAIRGDLQIEDRVVAVCLQAFQRVADVGQPAHQLLIGQAGEVDVVAQPLARQFHGRRIVASELNARQDAFRRVVRIVALAEHILEKLLVVLQRQRAPDQPVHELSLQERLDADADPLAIAPIELARGCKVVVVTLDGGLEVFDAFRPRCGCLDDRRDPLSMLFHERHHHRHFGNCLLRAGSIGLIDHEDVADLHKAGFDGLDVVAHSGNEHDDVRLHGANHFHLVLADADGFHEHDFESRSVEKIDDVVRGPGQAAEETASGHGADEDAAVGVEIGHPDAITENRAATEWRRWMFTIVLRQRGDESRLSRPGRAGDAHDARPASGRINVGQKPRGVGMLTLDEGNGASQSTILARQDRLREKPDVAHGIRKPECRTQNAERRIEKDSISSFFILHSAFCIHLFIVHRSEDVLRSPSAEFPKFLRRSCRA